MYTLIITQSPANARVEKLKTIINSLTDFSEPEVVSYENAEHLHFQTNTEMVIIFLAGNDKREQALIRFMRERFSGHLLIVGEIVDPKTILRSLEMGGDAFLEEGELETTFVPCLCRLLNKPGLQKTSGELLGVVSVSGGCGASTLAVNLAALTARQFGRSLLIDLHPGQGDLPNMLDLKPQFTLADVSANESRMDQAMFEKLLVRHSSGVHLLGSPMDFGDVGTVTGRGVKHALALSRRTFLHTVVDMEDCFHEEQAEVLRAATRIFLVCRLDFSVMCNTRRIMDHLAKMEIKRTRIKIVVNQRGLPNELPIAEAEDALGEKLISFIPHDPKTFNAAHNTGVPVILKSPETDAAKSIMRLVNIDARNESRSSVRIPNIKALLQNIFFSERHR